MSQLSHQPMKIEKRVGLINLMINDISPVKETLPAAFMTPFINASRLQLNRCRMNGICKYVCYITSPCVSCYYGNETVFKRGHWYKPCSQSHCSSSCYRKVIITFWSTVVVLYTVNYLQTFYFFFFFFTNTYLLFSPTNPNDIGNWVLPHVYPSVNASDWTYFQSSSPSWTEKWSCTHTVILMAMLTNRHVVSLAVNHTLALAQCSSVTEMARCLSGDSKRPEGKPRGFLWWDKCIFFSTILTDDYKL